MCHSQHVLTTRLRRACLARWDDAGDHANSTFRRTSSRSVRFLLPLFFSHWLVTGLYAQERGPILTDEIEFDRAGLFAEVDALVRQHFFDEKAIQISWVENLSAARDHALSATSHDEFAAAINKSLKQLNKSHTHYFSRLNPKRYQILGVFHELYDQDKETLFVYEGIGIDTIRRDGRTLISAVIDGFPAQQAGLRFGDEIVAVDDKPFHPILSFSGKAGTQVCVAIRRGSRNLRPMVDVRRLDGRTMFTEALKASVRVIQSEDCTIGYLHLWSYAGRHFQEIVEESLLWGPLSQCDALIVDLRDGWGGASPTYLNLFRKPILETKSFFRNQPPQTYTGVWGKPVALVANGGTTSGKELFCYGFKKLGLGKVVGEKTAGAVVAGRGFLLSNEDFLYLAVADIQVDNIRLEGTGVTPHIPVERRIEQGHQYGDNDPQIQAAVKTLRRALFPDDAG